jgi:hypothetical protein
MRAGRSAGYARADVLCFCLDRLRPQSEGIKRNQIEGDERAFRARSRGVGLKPQDLPREPLINALPLTVVGFGASVFGKNCPFDCDTQAVLAAVVVRQTQASCGRGTG